MAKLIGVPLLPLQLGELHKILDGRINSGEHCHSVDPEARWRHWMGSPDDGAIILCGLWRGNPVVHPDER